MDIKIFEFEIMGVKVNVMLTFIIFVIWFSDRFAPYQLMGALAIAQGILFHEFGHVYVFRKMKALPVINLRLFGGEAIAIIPDDRKTPAWQMLLSISGVFMNFVFATIAFVLLFLTQGHNTQLDIFLTILLDINILLGILNSQPIFPLDGAHFLENLLSVYMRRLTAEKVITVISLVGSSLLVMWGLLTRSLFIMCVGVIFFLTNQRRMKTI